MRGTTKGSRMSTLNVDFSYLYNDLYSDGQTIFTYSPSWGRRDLSYSEVRIRFANDRHNNLKTRVRVRSGRQVIS